jgi:NAD(P)-dependent dehydrogenase (short-subunit alcohol dehydrogenase family)
MVGAGRVMTGKVAVITGAAEGIGAGLVTGYRGRGWSVMASATILRPPNDPEVLAVEGDIADPAGADRVIDAALERFGRLDARRSLAGRLAGHERSHGLAMVTSLNRPGLCHYCAEA